MTSPRTSGKNTVMEAVRIAVDDLRRQLSQIRRPLKLVYAPLVLAFILLGLQPFAAVSDMTRDDVAVTDSPVYTGLISDLGMFIWTAAIAICLFSAHLLARIPSKRLERRFLVITAGFLFVLLLDDRLMLHEEVIPSGEFLYIVYGLSLLYVLYRYQKTILESRYIYLVLALGFLGLSASLDITVDLITSGDKHDTVYDMGESLAGMSKTMLQELEFLIEDGLKFFGIVSWLVFCLSFGLQHLTELSPRKRSAQPSKRHS